MPRTTRSSRSAPTRKAAKAAQPAGWHRFARKRTYMAALFAVLFAGFGAAGMMVSRAAVAAPSGIITGIGSKCIDIKNNQRFNGQVVWLYPCDGNPAQQWTMNDNGSISSQGYCLDVKGMGTTAKTPVWIWQCVGNTAQVWKKQSNGTLLNPASGMCLDDIWGSTATGNQFWIYPCDGGVAQVWRTPSGPAATWGDTVNLPGGGWHRMAKMKDGSWLQVMTTGVSGTQSNLVITKSTDNARTWSYVSTVSAGNRLVDNGFLYVAPNGDLLLTGRNNVINSSYKISQWRSTDGGSSWKQEGDISQVYNTSRGLWEPYYYTAGSAIVNVWADETINGYSQAIVHRVSYDNGKTWGSFRIDVTDGSTGRPGMPVVTKMKNGQYMMAYEICATRNCNVYQKVSGDGINWPSGIGTLIPGVQCGPSILSLTDGRVMVTGCRTNDTNLATPVVWTEDYGATWRTNPPSRDDGGTFGDWPALYQTGTNEVMAVSTSARFGTLSTY